MDVLLPIRHAQTDLFICDLFDSFKDDMASMEHPIFALSTKPDTKARKYEHKGNTVEIFPSMLGLATIHDKDILLYLASQFMAELNRRQKQGVKNGAKEIEAPPQTYRFIAYDYFILTNRETNNLSYQRLEAGLDRLSGTRIKTNISTNGKRITKNFGIIDAFGIIREDMDNPKSKMIGIEVKLSDWFYNSLLAHEVLTINKNYFRLRKPLERRIYELCRKHCGKQNKWTIGLETLQKKAGSGSKIREFRRSIKIIIENNHLPDYQIYFDPDKKDLLIIRSRTAPIIENKSHIGLKPQTYENARKILKRHFDVYAVESEWLKWIEGKEPPQSLDGAFIGFCKMKISSL